MKLSLMKFHKIKNKVNWVRAHCTRNERKRLVKIGKRALFNVTWSLVFKWGTPLGNPYNHDDDDDDDDDTDDVELSQTLTSIFLVQNIHGIVGGELCLGDCLRGKS